MPRYSYQDTCYLQSMCSHQGISNVRLLVLEFSYPGQSMKEMGIGSRALLKPLNLLPGSQCSTGTWGHWWGQWAPAGIQVV